jgi:hypothetical protein
MRMRGRTALGYTGLPGGIADRNAAENVIILDSVLNRGRVSKRKRRGAISFGEVAKQIPERQGVPRH